MRTIDDILTELKASDSIDAKERFNEKLRGYLYEKYKSTDEAAVYKKFHRDYDAFLAELDSLRSPEERMSKVNRDLRARNNTTNWLSADKIPKRESIIDIAFILADSKKRNGEDIANDLLKSMGYPPLHASSEVEIFYIYALINGINYTDCLKLYKSYLSRTKPIVIDDDKKYASATSTVFHDELIHITNKKQLFQFVDSKRQYFGVASRKMNEIFSRYYNEMPNNTFKLVIKSYNDTNEAEEAEENADKVADAIVKALGLPPDIPESERTDIIKKIKKTQARVEKTPFTLYIKGEENARAVGKCVSDCGGKVSMRHLSQIEQKLDFYIFFAGNDSLDQLLKDFSNTPADKYIYSTNKKDELDTSVNRSRYDKYLAYRECRFRPLKTDSFTTFFSGIDSVLKNEKSFSRGGMLLWLLYYYCKSGDNERYFSLSDANDIISTRYLMLNEDDYFDRFIITLFKFRLIDGKVFFGEEEIESTKLNTNNIHELRHSIIRLFERHFNSSYAVDLFIDKDKVTTSLIFKSTQERLGIKKPQI